MFSTNQTGLTINAIKSTLMALLALGIAFAFNTDEPYWAAVTANALQMPYLSATIKRSVFRWLGTLISCAVVVILCAFFIQDRWVFLISLALWVYACIFIAKHPFSPLMLAGYTAIVLGGYIAMTPEQYFNVIVFRITEISIGILTVIVIDSLIFPHYAGDALDKTINALLGQSKAMLKLAYGNDVSQAKNIRRNIRSVFIKTVVNLHDLFRLARIDSHRIKIRANLYRELLDQSQLLYRYSSILQRHIAALQDELPQQQFVGDIKRLIPFFKKKIDDIIMGPQQNFSHIIEKEVFAQLYKQPSRLTARNSVAMNAKLFSQIEQLVEYAGLINNTLSRLTLLKYKIYQGKTKFKSYRKPEVTSTFPYKEQFYTALIPFTTILVLGTIWFETTWNFAFSMFLVGSVYSVQVAYSKIVNGVDLLCGVLLGGAMAFIALIFLPMTSTFFGLCLVLFPFIFYTSIYKRLHPDTFIYRVAAYIFILTIKPTQLMVYDITNFFNTWLSLIIAFSLIALISKIVRPVNPNICYAQSIGASLKHFSHQLQRLLVQLTQKKYLSRQARQRQANYNYFYDIMYWEDLLRCGEEDNYNKAIFQDLTDSLLRLNSIIYSINKLFLKRSYHQLESSRNHIIELINELNHTFDSYANQFIKVKYLSKGKFREKTAATLRAMVTELQGAQSSASAQHCTANTLTANASTVSRITLLVEETIEFQSIMKKVDLRKLQEARF